MIKLLMMGDTSGFERAVVEAAMLQGAWQPIEFLDDRNASMTLAHLAS